MIPFASERGNGQDLAAHLQNAEDNEYIELADVRGAVAQDLHGAFAEWEAQAHGLTRCKNYLFSLSINPDDLQGRIDREAYFDYIARVEAKNGIAGQPRAVVFHIKDGREHCHVVWSRIDAEAGKAINLPFYKDKLMTVSREFARDHGIELPQGYHADEERQWRRNRQLSRYDAIKQKETGITHEQRMAVVTKAWRSSDTGAAFVHALEERGYVLARGANGTRPVLVDIYGHTYALTRMIDDPPVKTKHVRERLGADYTPDKLKSVEEMQALAKERRQAIEDFEKARRESEQVALLIRKQKERRVDLEGKIAMHETAQAARRQMLDADQFVARRELRAGLVAELRERRVGRARNRPSGLAAFLGKVMGISLAIKKLYEYRDRQRIKTYRAEREALTHRQAEQLAEFDDRQKVQAADLVRQQRALDQIEKKELASVQQALRKEHRQAHQKQHVHSPNFALTLGPPGRSEAVDKAATRYTSETRRALEADEKETPRKQMARRIDLIDAFTRAADSDDDDDGGSGGDDGGKSPGPPNKPGPDRPKRRRRRRKRDRDMGRGM